MNGWLTYKVCQSKWDMSTCAKVLPLICHGKQNSPTWYEDVLVSYLVHGKMQLVWLNWKRVKISIDGKIAYGFDEKFGVEDIGGFEPQPTLNGREEILN